MKNDYIVKPVYKALQVLLCLGEERHEMTLTEICYQVNLPKTTVFRYLQTLCACGFVTHDAETDLYRLGVRIWELGGSASEQLHIREVALPFMQELRNRFNETVNLGMLDGTSIVYLEMVESRHALRMRAELGGRDPVYSTALGKVMLAFMPEEKWANHLPPQLQERTPQTITVVSKLKDELIETKRRGFALDRGENEAGVSCIGAPIFDQRGHVSAAISFSAPATRLARAQEPAIALAVMQTAAAISLRQGYRAAEPA